MELINKHEITNTASLVGMAGAMDTVKEVPVFYGNSKELTENYKGIYNKRTGKLAQIASKYYQIIQHNDVLQALSEELEAKNIPVTGRLDNFGDRMRLDLVFGTKTCPVKDDANGIRIGMRVVNSYNKATSFRLEMYGFRMVCQNGMSLGNALNNIKEVTFHMGAEKNLQYIKETIRRFMGEVISSSEQLQNMVNTCMKDSVAWKEVGKIMEKLLAHKKHREAICAKLGISVIEVYNKDTKKRTFSYVLEKEGKEKLTRWDLYNAITNYASHTETMGLSIENKMQEVAQRVLKTPTKKLIELEVRAI